MWRPAPGSPEEPWPAGAWLLLAEDVGGQRPLLLAEDVREEAEPAPQLH